MNFSDLDIYDSIVHPNKTGEWFGQNKGNTFESTVKDLKDNKIIGANSISLPYLSLAELEEFYTLSVTQEIYLYPVAAINGDEEDLFQKISQIKEIGYKAIKLHIRLSNLDLDLDFQKIELIFKLCEKFNLIVFFCTYYHSSIKSYPLYSLKHYLVKLLKASPNVKIVLLHGGDFELMNLVQLSRFNSNILIDLSYTFIKFRNSSLETDIKYLLNNFDKRICFGSDYPDYSISEFKENLEYYFKFVNDKDKIKGIAAYNCMNFLEINR